MNWTWWLLVAWLMLGAASTVYMVDKPRQPITHGQAIFSVFFNFGVIVWILIDQNVLRF